jgi:hypothetical protein
MKYFPVAIAIVLAGCSTSSTWKFRQSPSTLVVTQRVVVQKKLPILYVVHNDQGEWQFLADDKIRMDPVVELSIRDLIAIDSTVADLAYLKKGWMAWRTDKSSPWNSAIYK